MGFAPLGGEPQEIKDTKSMSQGGTTKGNFVPLVDGNDSNVEKMDYNEPFDILGSAVAGPTGSVDTNPQAIANKIKIIGMGGIPQSIFETNPEKAKHASSITGKVAAQILGDIWGKSVGSKSPILPDKAGEALSFMGSVVGPTLVETFEQGYDKAVLEGKFDVGEISKEAWTTAQVEALARTGGYFMKNARITAKIARLKDAVGGMEKQIVSQIDRVPALRMGAQKVIQIMDNATKGIKNLAPAVKAFINTTKKQIAEGAEYTFKDILNKLDELDNLLAGHYTSKKAIKEGTKQIGQKGGLPTRTGILPLEEIGAGLREVRDEMGELVVSGYKGANNQIHKLYEKLPRSMMGHFGDVIIKSLVGGLVGKATGSGTVGTATTLGLILSGHPTVQKIMFEILENQGRAEVIRPLITAGLREEK